MQEKTMKAVRLNGVNDLEYCDVPIPVPGHLEALCKVESVSICGTDPHIINGDFPGFWPKKFPLILGHEWSGVIVELGEGSAAFGWKVGDRVTSGCHLFCGQCKMCLEGRYTLCLNYGNDEVGHKQYGHNSNGAYAEYHCVATKTMAKIPDEMDFNLASCMDPLSIALHVVMRTGLEPGDSVLINGAGAQGLMSILCAKSMGAGKIMISGSGTRLDAAVKLGAIPIDYRKDDVVQKVRELTVGLGADRVVECSGTAKGVRTACDAVAKGGRISVVSLPGEDVAIPLRRIVLEEIEIVGNRANPNTLARAMSIGLEYEDAIREMITHEFPLSDYKTALDVFNGRKENSLKVVMKPQF